MPQTAIDLGVVTHVERLDNMARAIVHAARAMEGT
jgi:chemotaxis response regulator CheB